MRNIFEIFFEPGERFEIRALQAKTKNGRTNTLSGVFTSADHDGIFEQISKLEDYSGVYFTVNPLDDKFTGNGPELLPVIGSGTCAGNANIKAIKWLFIDCDPDKQGDMANEDERQKAMSLAHALRNHLAEIGFPEPIVAHSGNGYYLLYRVDGVTESVLKQKINEVATEVEKQHSGAKVDRAVFNPARIIRLPGTENRKDKKSPRLCELISVPEKIEIVKPELFALSKQPEKPKEKKQYVLNKPVSHPAGTRNVIADEYSKKADIVDLLTRHGWRVSKRRDEKNRYFLRPGKTDEAYERGESSASWDGQTFYVHSDNAPPFERNGYSLFSAYTLLEHNGDYAEATRSLKNTVFDVVPKTSIVDEYIQRVAREGRRDGVTKRKKNEKWTYEPLPDSCFDVPGFVNEFVEHCTKTAYRPNRVMAFATALASISLITGKILQDIDENTTNLYIIVTAPSGDGKDHARGILKKIIQKSKFKEGIANDIAHKAQLEEALINIKSPVIFMKDEMGDWLEEAKNNKQSFKHELLAKMKEIYTSANTYVMSRTLVSNSGKASVINRPHLVFLGTTTPEKFYDNLTEAQLIDGLFSRLTILDGSENGAINVKRGRSHPPQLLYDVVAHYNNFAPPGANLVSATTDSEVIEPYTVPQDDGVEDRITEIRIAYDKMRSRAIDAGDRVEAAVYSRAAQMVQKFALIYSASAMPHNGIKITLKAVDWANLFIGELVKRMISQVCYVTDSKLEKDIQKVIEWMNKRGGEAWHSEILRKTNTYSNTNKLFIETMIDRGDIAEVIQETPGKKYRVL